MMKLFSNNKIRYLVCILVIAFICNVLGGFLVFAEDDMEKYYLKGDESFKQLEAYDVIEGEPGAFFVEAEKGLISGSAMNIIEHKDASEGKGIAAKGGLTRTDPDAIANVDARFRFEVTERGLYNIYVRFNSPKKTWKATFFAFDNEQYRRLEYVNYLNVFKWITSRTAPITNPTNVNFSSAYLDVGTHVLNLKARNGGQIIDSILITKKQWTAMGYGSLPSEPYRYTQEELDVIEYERQLPKLTIDGIKYQTDVYIKKEDGEIVVPARNVLNMMGIDVQINDDYYLDDIHIESVDEKTARVSLMLVSEFSGSHIFYENMYEIKEAK